MKQLRKIYRFPLDKVGCTVGHKNDTLQAAIATQVELPNFFVIKFTCLVLSVTELASSCATAAVNANNWITIWTSVNKVTIKMLSSDESRSIGAGRWVIRAVGNLNTLITITNDQVHCVCLSFELVKVKLFCYTLDLLCYVLRLIWAREK